MSIRPVDFNGMIQSTAELSTLESELTKQPAIQQENASFTIERERLETPSKVNEKPDIDEDDGTVDADTEGEKGQYRRSGKGNRKKREKMSDGFVRIKSDHESFDIKI